MKFKHTAIWLLASVFLSAVLAGCSSPVDINTDYTPETDFSAYKTYRWLNAEPREPGSLEVVGGDIFDKRMRHHVDRVLADKGFTKLDSGPVDFKVNYDVLTEERQDIRTYNTGGYAGYGRGYYGYGGMSTTETRVTNYTQGTVILDIIQADDNLLVWRGTVDGRVTKDKTPEEREAGFEKVVGQLLANFPPPAAEP